MQHFEALKRNQLIYGRILLTCFRNDMTRYDDCRIQKVEFTQRNERIVPARFAIPSKMPTSPLAKSRRLSSSHGNLPSMISPRVRFYLYTHSSHLK